MPTQESGHHHGGDDDKPVTKRDLREFEHRIMSTIKDLNAAATSLSESADNLSTNVDTFIEKIDAVVDVLQNVGLPPEAEQALAALNKSKASVATASGHVDAEVAKLDNISPPPPPPTPAAKKKTTT